MRIVLEARGMMSPVPYGSIMKLYSGRHLPPLKKLKKGYGQWREGLAGALSDTIKIAEIVEMRQCDTERLGIDRGTRPRMRMREK
jgi:hypothetical protein